MPSQTALIVDKRKTQQKQIEGTKVQDFRVGQGWSYTCEIHRKIFEVNLILYLISEGKGKRQMVRN